MTAKQDRIATVLRVRRIQELQAAGELAVASAAARQAEHDLDGVRDRYDEHRVLDLVDDLVPARLRDRDQRALHARSIQRQRARVRDAVAAVEARRDALQIRSQAVKAMERLDERLAVEAEAERLRAETRELDERGALLALRARQEVGAR